MTWRLTSRIASGASAAASYTSASFLPTAHSLLVCFVHNENQTNSTAPSWTITDSAGLTWTSRAESTHPGGTYAGTGKIWTAPVGATPVAMTITVDVNIATTDYYAVRVVDVTGHDVDSPVVQAKAAVSGVNSGTPSDTKAVTLVLDSTPDASNLVLGFYGTIDNTGNPTLPSGYAAVTENQNPARAYAFYDDASASATLSTSDMGTGVYWGTAAGIELAASGAADPAFPSVVGTPGTENGTSMTTSQALNMPASIVAGELLICAVSLDGAGTMVTASEGWDKLGGSSASTHSGAVFAKVATGTDAITVTGGTTNDYASIIFRVQDHGVTDPATDITFAATTGTSATPDPPNCNPASEQAYLWVEGFSSDDDDDTTTYWSGGFTGIGQLQSASSTSSCLTAVAYRQEVVSAMNPLAMAMAASEEWWAWTLAVPPAAGGPEPITNTGTITPAGAAAKLGSKAATGSVTPVGVSAKASSKAAAGSVTASGSVSMTKVAAISLAGTVTPTGAAGRAAAKALDGTVPPAGTVARDASRELDGTLTPTGAPAKVASKATAGSVGSSSVVTSQKVLVRAFTGSITAAGTLAAAVQKALSSTVTPAGAASKATTKTADSTVTPSGVVARAFIRALTGTLTPVGVAAKLVAKVLSGVVTPAGAEAHGTPPVDSSSAEVRLRWSMVTFTSRSTVRAPQTSAYTAPDRRWASESLIFPDAVGPSTVNLAGVITPTSTQAKAVSATRTGSVTPVSTGRFAAAVQFVKQAAVVSSGLISRASQKTTVGLTTPVGSALKVTSKGVTGALQPAGTQAKAHTGRVLVGAIASIVGLLAKQAQPTKGGTLSPSQIMARAVSRAGSGTIGPDGSGVHNTALGVGGSTAPTSSISQARSVARAFAGAITPSSVVSVTRVLVRTFTGEITPSGAVALIKGMFFTSTITPASTQAHAVTTRKAGAVTPASAGRFQAALFFLKQATIMPSGTAAKAAARAGAGTLTPGGADTLQTALRETGSVVGTGTTTKATGRSATGTITPAGAVAKVTACLLAGSVGLAGVVTTLGVKIRAFFGSVAPAGTAAKAAQRAGAGSVAPAGGDSLSVAMVARGTVPATGTAAKASLRSLVGAVGLAGLVRKAAGKLLAGSVTGTGTYSYVVIDLTAGELFTHPVTLTLNDKGHVVKKFDNYHHATIIDSWHTATCVADSQTPITDDGHTVTIVEQQPR